MGSPIPDTNPAAEKPFDGTSPGFQVTVAPDGTEVTVQSFGSVQRFDLATGEPVGVPLTGEMISPVTPAVLSPDWRLVAISGDDGWSRVHDFATGEAVLELPPCTKPIGLGSDGTVKAMHGSRFCHPEAQHDVELRNLVIEMPSGEELLDLGEKAIEGFLGGAVFNPAGVFQADRFLAVHRPEEGLEVYDVPAGGLLTSLNFWEEWGEDWPLSLRFDPTGTYLAVGGVRGRAWVLDVEQVLEGVPAREALVFDQAVDPGELPAIDINRDGIMATSAPGALRLWELHSGQHLIQIPVDTSWPISAFTPEGDHLLYVDEVESGYVLRRFALDPDELIALAETRVTRGFTPEECDRYDLDC